MWKCSILEKIFGLRRFSGASRILSCKLDPVNLGKLKEIAISNGQSTSEYLREIVCEKLGELNSGGRKPDNLKTEIAALRHDFISAIKSLRQEILVSSLGWSFPPRTLPRTTTQKCTKAKVQFKRDAPMADTIDDGWQRRDRRRSKWGRW